MTGKTDEDVVINPVAPAGWKIVEGQNIPKTEKATPNGIDTVIVKVEHKTTTVPPTDPKTPEDKLPDNPDKHYPDGVGEKDLNKTIVRQITVVKPDGTRENHDQSVKLTRSATVDEVTGAITGYSDWTTGNFDEYDAPVIAGYTPSQAKVDGVKVTADSDFDPVVITYVEDPIGQDITVKKGDTPSPEDGVKNHGDLDKITDPKHPGTKTTYTWEKTPNTNVPGDVPATVIVHYPDGSNKPVDITVHVVDDTPVVPTKNPEPAGQDIHTPQGKVPTPESAITNKDKMPDGTKYTWKEIPDVNTLGKHPSVVVVTYPDGTAVEVKVNVFVDGTPEAKKETKAPVVKKQVVEPTKVETRQKLVNNYVAPRAVEVQRAQAKGKRQLPQTGAKENIASEVLGMLSVGLGALTAGFASKRRKKNR